MNIYNKMFWFDYYLVIMIAVIVHAKIPCDPESFQFINAPTYINHFTSYLFEVGNREEIGCAINASYLWELYLIVDDKQIPLTSAKYFQINSITRSTKNYLSIQDYVNVIGFAYGLSFAVKVTLIPRKTHFSSFRLHYVKVPAEQYLIGIGGGKEIVHTIGSGSLWLNVSVSRESGRNIGELTIKWKCEPPLLNNITSNQTHWEVPERFLPPNSEFECTVIVTLPDGTVLRESQKIYLEEPFHKPLIDISCVYNCHNANPYNMTKLKCSCHGNCDGALFWSVNPFDNEIQEMLIFPCDEENAMCIPPGSFDYGSTYDIVAGITNVNATYTINYGIPNISLAVKCISNCYKRHKEITFELYCSGDCKNFVYTWETTPIPYVWDSSITVVHTNKTTLSFAPYTFPRETGASILVHYLGIRAETSFMVETRIPKFSIRCEDNCANSNPSFAVKLTSICHSSTDICDIGGFLWSLDPSIGYFHWYEHASNDNKTFNIPADSYKHGEKVHVRLFVENVVQVDSVDINFAGNPKLEISCLKNCEENKVDPYRAVLLNVTCVGACSVYYNWNVVPDLNGIFSIFHGSSLVIPDSTYAPNQQVNITVTSAGTQAFYQLFFYFPPPIISIICIENCFLPADPNLDMVLQVICKKNCHGLTYHWTLEPKRIMSIWYEKFSLSPDNITITIRKKAFSYSYRSVGVNVFAHPGESNSTYRFALKGRLPKLIITCEFNCNKSKTTLRVDLKVRCLTNCKNLNYKLLMTDGTKVLSEKKWRTSKYSYPITLRRNTYSNGTVIHVQVFSKGTSAHYSVQYLDQTPSFYFRCSPRPCDNVLKISENIKVHIECDQDCIGTKFVWAALPTYVNKMLHKKISVSSDHMTVSIPANTFLSSLYIRLRASTSYTSQEIQLILVKATPDIDIECTFNCKHSNPSEPVTLEVICRWLCNNLDVYKWSVPLPNNLTHEEFWSKVRVNPKHTQIIIPANLFNDGDIIEIGVEGSYGATGQIIIAFVEPAPELTIVCRRNCEGNPVFDTILEAVCSKDCIVPKPLIWSLYPDTDLKMYSFQNKTITIYRFAYQHRDLVRLVISKGKGSAHKYLFFSLPQAEFYLKCTKNCMPGNTISPKLGATISAICKTNCKNIANIYMWHVDPLPIGRVGSISSYEDELDIPVNSYLDGSRVMVTATLGDLQKTLEIFILQPKPLIRIFCTDNCGYPHPLHNVKLKISCFQHCTGLDYKWSFTPFLGDSQIMFEENDTVVIMKETFDDGEYVDVVVKADHFSIVRKLKFAMPPPFVVLSCQKSCLHCQFAEAVTVTAVCKKNCYYLHYEWEVTPQLLGFIWNVNVTVGVNNESITIKEYTYSSGSNVTVTVHSNKSSGATVHLFYVESPIYLKITCLDNCLFFPEHRVIMELECTGDCSDIHSKKDCHIKPRAQIGLIINETNQWTSIIIIPSFSYDSGKNATLECKFKSQKVEYILPFRSSYVHGNCTIVPNFGVGGVTKHTMECINFCKGCQYRVFQVWRFKTSGQDSPGSMLLHYGINRYITDIYLTPAKRSQIVVSVGNKMNRETVQTYKLLNIINIFDYHSAFLRKLNDEDNVREYGIIHDTLNEIKFLFKINDYLRAMQLANSLIIAIADYFGGMTSHHLDIFRVIYDGIEVIEPYQILTIVRNAVRIDKEQVIMEVYPLLANVLQRVAQLVNIKKTAIPINSIVASWTSTSYLYIIDGIHLRMYHFFEQNANICPVRFANCSNNFVVKAKKMAIEAQNYLLPIFDLATAIYKPHYNHTRENSLFETNTFTYTCFTIPTNMTGNSYLLRLPYVKSQVFLMPETFQKSSRLVTLTFIYFTPYFFFFNHIFDDIRTDLIYFSITKSETTKVVGPYRVFLHVNKVDTKNISLHLAENEFIIIKIWVTVSYTFKMETRGTKGLISLSYLKPNKDHVQAEGIEPNHSISVPIKTSPLYLGIVGSGKVIVSFQMVKCISWEGVPEPSVDSNECFVADIQISDEFVVCDCNASTFIAANVLTPKYDLVQKQEHRFGPINKSEAIMYTGFIGMGVILTILLFVTAAHVSSQNSSRNRFHFLLDNIPNDKEIYVVSVQTGMWKNAGTSSRIAIQLWGSLGRSQVHVLNYSFSNGFQRNSAENFVLCTNHYLGDIRYICIWLHILGDNSSWFCDMIVVRHLETRKRYVFIVSRWFSLVHTPYTIRGCFTPLRRRRIHFVTKLETCVREHYNNVGLLTGRRDERNMVRYLLISLASLSLMITISIYTLSREQITLNETFYAVLIAVAVSEAFVTITDWVLLNTP